MIQNLLLYTRVCIYNICMDSKHFFSSSFIANCAKTNIDPMWFLDERIARAFKQLRNHFGPDLYVNNHTLGIQNSGYRTLNCPIGSKLSQHRFGRALDLHGIPHSIMVRYIKDNYKELGITTMEDPIHTPSWVHIDIRYTGSQNLLIVPGR